jgi:hypothetical protein
VRQDGKLAQKTAIIKTTLYVKFTRRMAGNEIQARGMWSDPREQSQRFELLSRQQVPDFRQSQTKPFVCASIPIHEHFSIAKHRPTSNP